MQNQKPVKEIDFYNQKTVKEDDISMRYLITNAQVVTPTGIMERGCVAVSDQRITGIYEHSAAADFSDYTMIDANGLYVSPGFIDIHVHGGGGYEFNRSTPDMIREICVAHARYGTTSILPTTLAAPLPELYETIHAVRIAKPLIEECNILGIHLEGPYFAQSQRGAQNPDHILNPLKETYMDLLDQWDQIIMMGAAPELLGGLELGLELQKRRIIASIAHSDATFDEITKAVEHGYTDVTHIYSGCSMVHRVNGYRIGGVVEAGLLLDELTVQVIADGKHLPAELLRLIYKNKGADKISLITDALFAAASDYKEGDLVVQKNGMQTVLEDGVMKLLDRQAFAGSVATTNQLVRNMVTLAGAPLYDAVKMAALTPATLLGIHDHKGKLELGYDADLVLFDTDIDIKMTMVMGKIIFKDDEVQTSHMK
jgi:N-acetylglucosamine-6-phosphate deacetylase